MGGGGTTTGKRMSGSTLTNCVHDVSRLGLVLDDVGPLDGRIARRRLDVHPVHLRTSWLTRAAVLGAAETLDIG